MATLEASSVARSAASGYPDDRNALQKALGLAIFLFLVVWDSFWMVMRVPLLMLLSPVLVPYLLIRRQFRRRR